MTDVNSDVCCFHIDRKDPALLINNDPYSCCYVPSAPGEVKAADAHLSQVFGQEPRDAAAQARVGVVEAWQQNYSSAACRLSKITEGDPACLDFLLALIPFDQRKHMEQVSISDRIQTIVSTNNIMICFGDGSIFCSTISRKKPSRP